MAVATATFERYCPICEETVQTGHDALCSCGTATERYFPEGQPMTYLDGGQWLDGPKLATWLAPFTILLPTGEPWVDSLRHRCREWAAGTTASVQSVDSYLVRLGFHLTEVPDECWLPRDKAPVPGPRASTCKHGHEFSPENTLVRADGRRTCKACRRALDAGRRPSRRLDSAPLAKWLREIHDELGTWEKVGKHVGLSVHQACRLSQGHYRRINRATAERILGDAGAEVYGEAW